MPTKDGQEAEFEIDDVQGDEVTLINPDASKAPEEPEKVTYKKQILILLYKVSRAIAAVDQTVQ